MARATPRSCALLTVRSTIERLGAAIVRVPKEENGDDDGNSADETGADETAEG